MRALFPEPDKREARPDWSQVPPGITRQLQEILKDKIIAASIAWGGYSPSAAFIATLGSGRKVFIKGTHPGQDTHGTQMLRQEMEAYAALADMSSFSPACYGLVSDGSEEGWMLAVFDYIDTLSTLPTLPWTNEKIDAVFSLLVRLHTHAPVALPAAHEKNYIERFMKPEGGWLRIRDEKKIADKFVTLFEDAADAQTWLSAALPALCGLQEKAAEISGAVGVLHQDIRSDNILFDPSGRAFLIDWPNACCGPVVLDLAGFIPLMSAESGIDAEILLTRYEKKSPQKTDRDSLAIALASFSGYMADNAYRAIPEKLPRLRWMQKTALSSMLHWATTLVQIPPSPPFKSG